METLATTKLSSKGQVVIPEGIRNDLGLREGDQFVVMGKSDVIILKTIHPLSMGRFDNLIQKARKQAKLAGLKKSDVVKAISKVRRSKKR